MKLSRTVSSISSLSPPPSVSVSVLPPHIHTPSSLPSSLFSARHVIYAVCRAGGRAKGQKCHGKKSRSRRPPITNAARKRTVAKAGLAGHDAGAIPNFVGATSHSSSKRNHGHPRRYGATRVGEASVFRLCTDRGNRGRARRGGCVPSCCSVPITSG